MEPAFWVIILPAWPHIRQPPPKTRHLSVFWFCFCLKRQRQRILAGVHRHSSFDLLLPISFRSDLHIWHFRIFSGCPSWHTLCSHPGLMSPRLGPLCLLSALISCGFTVWGQILPTPPLCPITADWLLLLSAEASPSTSQPDIFHDRACQTPIKRGAVMVQYPPERAHTLLAPTSN